MLTKPFISAFLFTLFLAVVAIGSLMIHDRINASRAFNKDNSVVEVDVDAGHGSGFYIGNGQIITAAHVAKDANKDGKVMIKFHDQRVSGTVRWFDEVADVALITLDNTLPGLQAANMACSEPDPAVGDGVEAIGFPLNLQNVHTRGRVAAPVMTHEDKMLAFLADLTIAPGNSGGPVFTAHGTIAGLADAVASTTLAMVHLVLFPIAYIVPKSVICKELLQKHDAPTFTN